MPVSFIRSGRPAANPLGVDRGAYVAAVLQRTADDHAVGAPDQRRDRRSIHATADQDRCGAGGRARGIELIGIGRPAGAAARDDDGVGPAAFDQVGDLVAERARRAERRRVLDVDVGDDADAGGTQAPPLAQQPVGRSLDDALIGR
jgi:hypothetical protein